MPLRLATRFLSALAPLTALALLTGCPGPPQPRPRPPATFDPLPDEEEEDMGSAFSEEEQTQSRGKLGGVWQSCHGSFQVRSSARPDLERLAKACGPPTSLVPVTDVRVGEPQSAKGAAQRLTFAAKGGGRCYRVFAVGDATVQELDVALVDEDGSLIAADRKQGPSSVLPLRGPLCLDRAGSYTLEVSVVHGEGAFALQVWGDP